MKLVVRESACALGPLVLGAALALCNAQAHAADVSTINVHIRREHSIPAILVRGTITTGDARKLSAMLMKHPDYEINLDSPGGDVAEAARMGEIIKMMRNGTAVLKNGICASACFLVWLNGRNRAARGEGSNPDESAGLIGLHRPRLQDLNNSEESLQQQRYVVRAVTSYLEARNVPRRLIDLMMSRASNDIYWMTDEDLVELGDVPADLQELYVARCKDELKLYWKELVKPKGERDERLLEEIRPRLSESSRCMATLDRASSDATLDKLRRGWLPGNPYAPANESQPR